MVCQEFNELDILCDYDGDGDYDCELFLQFGNNKYASGNFIDAGCDPSLKNGPYIAMTNCDPQSEKGLNWTIIPLGGHKYAIKSCSTGYYLDGRNPDHTGANLFLTNRHEPQSDKYL